MRYVVLILSLLIATCGVAQEWSTLEGSNNCTPRHENSLAAVGNTLVLLGGRGLRPVESLDIASNTWTRHIETPLEMSHFQAITFQGEVWVLGAFTGPYPHEIPIPDVYIFNLEKNEWRKGPVIPSGRRRGAAGAFVHNDKIYLIGGEVDGHYDGTQAWFDEFDPSTNSWKILPDAPTARDHISASVVDNKLVIAGGRQSSAKTNKVLETTLASVDIYDFETGEWSTLSAEKNIPTERAGASAVAYGQLVLIIGGESGAQESSHSDVEGFNISTMTWEKLPSMQQGRHGTGAVNVNGKIYVVAGSGNRGGGPELSSMEVLTPD